ncbi:ABC transporter substrate-binding protein [Oceanobacillus oncorhynchi subsp. incaldanensis]|uniref:Tripartite tricarboxylate transporter family receptor n=2 Tax=Oceanobacillus TaxID=182709 RepID=A0A0A1M8P1_9BACI|nr:tripartite tricarboxylate transporter substrate binding protein [Oceanobacillus oncorhynchi]MDM8102466.1 tripartite tricarboxylate transporter substrate binding protein [Oceanobacillus oncorhynchi]UUI40280.1 tripartite tricarboxylate transporter substrate binding protein [Oceanobacillus oncorhynchi]GIO20739.1 ABC transporter substrate-binding protein [Oceanobacillus oncorhynchi subsp. incaldanensis]CEI81700.1 Tripartite tricarboxylate transporter family receptor [Oceanobacillus oncorhynchi]
MKFKIGLVLLSVMMLLAGCGGNSEEGNAANNYPERNIEVLVGHGAGGGTDLFARAVTSELEDILGVNINVVNQEGGAGVVAAQNAYNAPSDGYTLVGDAAFPLTVAAGTNQHGLDDFTPIARFQSDTYALWVDPDKYSSIEDFIQAAEDNPGEITVGGTGSMGMDEFTVFLLGQEAEVDLSFIAMEGAGDMHAGVIGGHLDAMVEEFGPAKALYDDGSVEPLVVFSEERLDEFPDLPTTVENGWDLTDGNERGFYIKSDADPEIISVLEEAMKEVYDSEEYKAYEEENYLHLREGWMDSEEFTQRTEELIERYTEVADELQGN